MRSNVSGSGEEELPGGGSDVLSWRINEDGPGVG
jgi:hypothetical protein